MSKQNGSPGDWPVATLEQLCEIKLGKMLSPKSRTGLRPRPYLRNANVLWNRFDLSSIFEMDFAEEEEAKFELRDGDILVCEGGEPGRAAVWQGQISPCFYQKALLRLRPRHGVVDPHFVMFRLWLGAITGEFTHEHAKTAIAHLPEVRLRALRIGAPSITEQKRIVRLLNDGMAQIEHARVVAEAQVGLASCLVDAVIATQFEGAAVREWPQRRLSSLTETCSGLTPSRGRPDYFRGQIPWVKTGELLDGTILGTDESVTEVAVSECGLRVLPSGTLLVAMYGQGKTRGRTGLLGCAATTNQACFAILPNPVEFSSEFLQLWFRCKYQELRDLTEGRGGSQPNLNGEILRSLEVPLPPIHEQLGIVRATEAGLHHVENVRRSLEEQMDSIATLPAALLRQAFSGGVVMARNRERNGNGRRLITQQSVNGAVKSICDIMRRSNCAGALQYVPELTWILFLRILDEREQRETEEAEAVGAEFTPSLEPPYRWRDWADPDGPKRRDLGGGHAGSHVLLPPRGAVALSQAARGQARSDAAPEGDQRDHVGR